MFLSFCDFLCSDWLMLWLLLLKKKTSFLFTLLFFFCLSKTQIQSKLPHTKAATGRISVDRWLFIHRSKVMPWGWIRLRWLCSGCVCGRWSLWAPRRAPPSSCRPGCWGSAGWPYPTPQGAAGAGSPGRWCRWQPDAPRWRWPRASAHR